MMGVAAEWLRNDFFELGLNLIDGFAGREASAVADSKDMSVDREGFFAKSGVEHNIRSLASDPGEQLELVPGARYLVSEAIDQRPAERDDILRFGVEQADRLDCLAKSFFSEINHLLRCFDALKERSGCAIDAGVRGLGREHDGDQQSVGIDIVELGCR